MLCMPTGILLEKTHFSFASGCQLEMDSGLGMRACVCSLSQLWDPIGFRTRWQQHAAPVSEFTRASLLWCVEGLVFLGFFSHHPSLRVHTCVRPLVCRGSRFSRCLLPPLALMLFLPPLPHRSLRPAGRDLVAVSHSGLGVLRSLVLCTLSRCGCSCLFSSAEGRSFSDDG